MSNHLAVATVSAALGRLLQGALDFDVPGALVSHDRPGGPGDDARRGINIFLFQVTPDAALRNLDLPVRDATGRVVVGRAAAALDLHYLLTFYGDAATFEPERMLGSAARILHERGLLDRDLITRTVEDPPNVAALAGSDLADAHELVKFSPTPLNLEELSKLWSILFQTSYRLSVAYRASVLQIEARSEVRDALPVRRRGGFVLPISLIGIDVVQSIDGPTRPIVWGGRIVMTGRGFAIPGAAIVVSGVVATPDSATATATATRVEIDLLPASFGGTILSAGVATARVRLPPPPGAPPQLARESASVAFLLRPALTVPLGAVAAGPPDGDGLHDGTVTVDLVPGLGEGQTARLVLDRTAPRPPVGTILAPQLPAAPVFPLAQLVFEFTGLAPGTYLVRLQVDGAESPLTVETDPLDPDFGTVIGPKVTVP